MANFNPKGHRTNSGDPKAGGYQGLSFHNEEAESASEFILQTRVPTEHILTYYIILFYTLTNKVSLPLGCPVKCLYSWRPPKEQDFRVWVAQGRGKLTFIGPQVKPALTGLTAPKKGLSSLKWPIYRNKSQQEITAKTRNFHLFKMAGIGLNSPM